MTSATIFRTLFILLVCSFTACTESLVSSTKTEVINEYPNVDKKLWLYFTRFENAAAERGRIIDLTNAQITGKIKNIDIDHVAGLCHYNATEPNELVIDNAFWRKASNERRELIVFHELGHCFLQRAHNDKTTPEGICRSIMRSGTGGCLDLYNNDTRTTLLNELFRGE